MRVVNRSYKLKLLGNQVKTDTARYTQMRFNQYCNMFSGRLFFGQKKISTAGMSMLANQALYKTHKVIKAQTAATKATGDKANVPFFSKSGCYAKLENSNTNTFDYWIAVSNQFDRTVVRVPANSHKALNKALKSGWKLSSLCEFKMINGNPYAMVFVSKEVAKPKAGNFIGIDVGYKYSITDSNGYIGRKVSGVIRTSKLRHAERRRQKHKISSKVKSTIKQILDIEAKRLLGRSDGMALAVESPKRLANLRSGKLQGWSRCYFANRLETLCREEGRLLVAVSPYQTSITCNKCQAIDKQSRNLIAFNCTSCGHTDHADVNAAKNIARRASETSGRKKSCHREVVIL